MFIALQKNNRYKSTPKIVGKNNKNKSYKAFNTKKKYLEYCQKYLPLKVIKKVFIVQKSI